MTSYRFSPFFLLSGAHQDLKQRGGTTRPPAANNFHITLILAPFFIENGHAMSRPTVTLDKAKIFAQLTGMSKSRSSAKIRERRLQPLLV